MKNTRKAESFAGIIVGVFILSFVILGIVSVMNFSLDVDEQYRESNTIYILRKNITNIVGKLDTSGLLEKEVFYVYKNTTNDDYELFTGAVNEKYRYINTAGEYVDISDPSSVEGDVYSRILWLSREDSSISGQDNQIIQVALTRLVKK